MVLYSELEDYEVVNQLGKKIGKFNDLIVDFADWKVKNLILSHGMLKKNVSVKLEKLKKADEDEKKLIIPTEAQEEDVPESSSFNTASVEDDLLGKKVVSSDDHDVGKVYDVDIPISLKNWKIWKILIKRGMKERRLRIGPDEIESIAEEVILKKSISEIEDEGHHGKKE